MVKLILLAASALSLSATAFAATRTYCGRIACASALDGCQVSDGKTNPIVMIADEAGHKYHYVSDGLAAKVESLDFKCACVTGNVSLSSGSGETYAYFSRAISAVEIPEAKCAAEGL